MNMINVDFYDLKKTNPDVVGWLKVNGTNINYPFVQTKDNKYYLTHGFNKKYNEAGWVFSTSSDYLQTSFSNDTEYQDFLDMIKNRSSYTFNTSVSTTDNILTLSTCFNTVNDKLVMHAKLIKKQVK